MKDKQTLGQASEDKEGKEQQKGSIAKSAEEAPSPRLAPRGGALKPVTSVELVAVGGREGRLFCFGSCLSRTGPPAEFVLG